MASHYEAPIRKPLVLGDKGYHDVSVDIAAPVEGRANRQWWIVFTIALVALLWGIGAIVYTISTGRIPLQWYFTHYAMELHSEESRDE